MPKWVIPSLLILGSLALLPLALVARARSVRSEQPRVHIIQDMDAQGKFKPQRPNYLFADGRAMRPPVAGTVARGRLSTDEHLERGRGQLADERAAVNNRVDNYEILGKSKTSEWRRKRRNRSRNTTG